MADQLISLTSKQIRQIAKLEYLRETEYYNLDFEKTLQYIVKRYIEPISEYLNIEESTLVDCGAGFGWLAFGYLLSGGKSATLCDIDVPRLKAAEEISEILGIRDKCSFIAGPMENLTFQENEFDIFASVETLEHVGKKNIDTCINLISNTAKKMVVLTTPNKLFPLVLHDNKVPFSHWIPKKYRKFYTGLFGVKNKPLNDFVSPFRLNPIRKKFKPVSKTLTFNSYPNWKNSYPFYSPYNYSNRWKESPPILLSILYYVLSKLFRTKSYYLFPNLCRIWLRK
ncbi:MAG: class I SAM-dependent methyltransferase [Balneola sp.]